MAGITQLWGRRIRCRQASSKRYGGHRPKVGILLCVKYIVLIGVLLIRGLEDVVTRKWAAWLGVSVLTMKTITIYPALSLVLICRDVL